MRTVKPSRNPNDPLAPPTLWEPPADLVEHATMTRFMRDQGLETYAALWEWSVQDIDRFWGTLWRFLDIDADGDPATVLGSRQMPGAKWFPDVAISYPEHIFRGRRDSDVAIVHASESRELDEWTWGDLRRETAAIRSGLMARGVGPGDRVGAYMPNIPETVAAFLATASLGAIWTSAPPEFGAQSVMDRFAQIEPKVILAIDGYRYGGRDFDCSQKAERIAGGIGAPAVRLGYLDGTGWESGFLADGELAFERAPFDHPLWVLYSSGTTGLPKPIVHSHGGILLEHLKMMHLHLDLHGDDRLFWFTTTGWMMWNFLVGGLLTEAAIVLYDGNPGTPGPERLWDLAADAGVTTFGTSAAFIHNCMKAGIQPAADRDLSALKAVGSTGSPLSPEGFDWIYDHLGADTWLFSTSGGTDLCTAFVGGTPLVPVYSGELQALALAADIHAFDEQGDAVIDEVGELVITQPMPSMPVFFWGDEDGSRYRESYFETYEGVWRHGDWIRITPRGSAVIYGRSDATINRGGIRMGTAEIYRAVLAVAEVVDALIVDVPPRSGTGDSRMSLFVVMAAGARLTDEITTSIKRRIREDCSPRHVPDEIIAVDEIPRTLSGKVLEVPIKKILMGGDPDKAVSRDALANPSALDWFIDYAGGVHR